MSSVKIIAEAGPNHNGNINLAYKLVDIAKRSGADYVKFQTSIPSEHISKYALKADYQKRNTKKNQSQLDMSKKMTLSFKEFKLLKRYCDKKKIKFLSTAFGLSSINFLKKFKMEYFKIPSGEINNVLYLKKIGRLKKKVILSTGMSTMKEISYALKILTLNGTKKKNITVLQCNTEYPTPLADVNLRAMLEIKKKFKINVGYSDHTKGTEASVIAASIGASIIEKHFTISQKLKGPDHKSSLLEKDLKEMIKKIKNVEVILGNKIKKPTKSEKKNIKIARNSIVANRDIFKGEKFTYKNLTVKRPGSGISPTNFFKMLGKKAKKNFKKDQLISI